MPLVQEFRSLEGSWQTPTNDVGSALCYIVVDTKAILVNFDDRQTIATEASLELVDALPERRAGRASAFVSQEYLRSTEAFRAICARENFFGNHRFKKPKGLRIGRYDFIRIATHLMAFLFDPQRLSHAIDEGMCSISL